MSERGRNLAVGVTTIIGLALLGGMILIFTGMPSFLAGGYDVHVRAEGTMGASVGDAVYLAGMAVGKVTDIRFSDPQAPTRGVTITLNINEDVSLPANTAAFFFTRGVTGQAYIELKEGGPMPRDAQGRVVHLAQDGSAVIPAELRGSSLIPEELRGAIDSFGRLAENINQLFAPPPGEPSTAAATTTTAPTDGQSMQGVLVKLNRTLDGLNRVLANEENIENIRKTLANVAEASEAANEAMVALKGFAAEARQTTTQATATVEQFAQLAQASRVKLDELSDRLIEDAEKVSDVLQTANAAMTKIERGEGTAGKLLNDPRLYNDLLQATQQLNQTLQEFRDMARQWRESGVPIKMR